MALSGAAYKPDAMIFLMAVPHELMDTALAVKLVMTDNPNLKVLVPHHHRVTPPPGATTIADVRAALDTMGLRIPITNQVRGRVHAFTK